MEFDILSQRLTHSIRTRKRLKGPPYRWIVV
jgi:hypothetical protein